jgi:hypothetical protein
LTGDFGPTEVEPFEHQRDDIALVSQRRLYLAAQPIPRVSATLKRPRSYVLEYAAFEVATGDAVVIEEDVIAVLCQVPEYCQCPWNIGAAITDKDGLLDALHNPCRRPLRGRTKLQPYQNG